ncbi:hypothetical protein F4813DRAFT_375838 [Daldinia decipiens]|uniref:uncharacterized protein n=1 Tax=Daldinia decipiens TaxID=326647 RepID=UPI0020C1CE12|nr:uncharacterized protein F4813DRAFT_375838 [Daldinia decipiens]KAI1653106.1 hypothetical protein F4813DRAFT_375838 [Daldinia decipiens]
MDYDLIGRLLLSLPAGDAETARMAALADKISTYFTPNENLVYRGVAGIGRHGGAIIFLDRRRHPSRKIVVKYSISDQADADLRNEAQFLEMLRGAEHIGQTIPLAEATLNVSGTGKRPTLALDFIPYGTIYAFRSRMDRTHYRVPSRFLWRAFLCLVRQVLAMAFPPQGGPDEPLRRERFHQHRPLGVVQNSPHGNNVIIGDLTSDDFEHSLAPILKLIDFGRGEILRDEEGAIYDNIGNIGVLFIIIFERRLDESYLDNIPELGWQYEFVDRQTGENRRIGTAAPPFFTESKYIDVELRDLVVRCMAVSSDNTPSLEELVGEAERGVAKGPEDIVYEDTAVDPRQTETDEMIRNLVQRFILDAGTIEEEAATLNRRTVNHHLGTTLLGINATTRPGPAQRHQFKQSNLDANTVVDNDID